MQKTFHNFPELKRARQKTDSYCGPATLEMLASFIGVPLNQNRLVRLSKMEKKIVKHGMNIDDLARATKITIPQSSFWCKEKATANDLDLLINTYRFPVGVEWQGVFEDTDKNFPDDGHYSVVTYINRKENKIMLADPFRQFAGADREFKIDFFKRRWWDTNGIRDPKTKKIRYKTDKNMIYIITPNDATFPLDIGMKRCS